MNSTSKKWKHIRKHQKLGESEIIFHKGLEEFYETGSKKGIQPDHAPKLGRMLDRLDASTSPQDMNLPGYRLHPLKGNMKDKWSVTVSDNWRMTFYFEGQDAYLVDYLKRWLGNIT